MSMLIPRLIRPVLERLARGYPILAITGPRQSGKTTLAREVFPDHPYVSFEDPDVYREVTEDPRGFLARYETGAVFDEAQRAPSLFSYIQSEVDRSRQMGRYILTGSQQFGLMSGITQSLAGRVAMTTLLPFSLGELDPVDKAPADLNTLLLRGLYPPVHDRGLGREWYANYVRTYIERDVRQMLMVRDLGTFTTFLRLCAGRTGQLLNLSSLASDVGVSRTTIQSWLSVLEASFVIHLLHPHHENFRKRLVKNSKLYFLDPGLAAWLLGIETAQQLHTHPLRGSLFETWVISELIKNRFNEGETSNLYFWRDHRGMEVDVIVDQAGQLIPIEVKSGATVHSSFFAGLRTWQILSGRDGKAGWVIFGGRQKQSRESLQAIPWRDIGVLLHSLAVS